MLGGVDIGDYFLRIVLQHWLALILVGLNATLDRLFPGIIPAVIFESTLAEAAV